ncbi:MAG: ABC transporter ATP-binding protein [bacterium]|nr:ABC transporter ATP-binding protein [bacterium]
MTALDSATHVRFDDVSFAYQDDNSVLTHCSAEFAAGVVHYVVGPSGCGKSTLGLLLCGVMSHKSGNVKLPKDASPTMVLQFPENLFLTDSVEEELALLPDAQAEEKALSMLADFDLHFVDIARKSPHRLSFGQRRLFAIALQVSLGSKVIVLDEPSLGLDEVHVHQLANWLGSASKKGTCSIVITHDLDLIAELSGEVHILGHGSFQWHGPSTEFLKNRDMLLLAAAQ